MATIFFTFWGFCLCAWVCGLVISVDIHCRILPSGNVGLIMYL